MNRAAPSLPASAPSLSRLARAARDGALPWTVAASVVLTLAGPACADSAPRASLAHMGGAETSPPTLVSATSCREAEAAVRAQARLSLRLETARLRRAILDGRLLPGATLPARVRAPLKSQAGAVGARAWPRAPEELATRVGRISVAADRVYAVTPHALHVAPREPEGGLTSSPTSASVAIAGEAWGVVAAGPWALVLSSVVAAPPGDRARAASAPTESVVLTRVDASDLAAPRVVAEEALDGQAYAARADGGVVTLVLGAPWSVEGAATSLEGLSPDATPGQIQAAFDALDARNDAAVEAASLASLLPQRRGLLWTGALDPTDVRPATSCEALYYPARVLGEASGAGVAARAPGGGGLSVGAAVTYVAVSSAAPGAVHGGAVARVAEVLGGVVGDWRHVALGGGRGFFGAAADTLDEPPQGAVGDRPGDPSGPSDATSPGRETLVAFVRFSTSEGAEPRTLALDAAQLLEGGPLGDRALLGVSGGRALAATRRSDGGARLTVLSGAGPAEDAAGDAAGRLRSLAIWGVWEVEGTHGGASVVHTDGAWAYVQPADPRAAVASVSLDRPDGPATWTGPGDGCAWVSLLPRREGRLVALRRCGEEGERLSWAVFTAADPGSGAPLVSGVGAGVHEAGELDWTDIIWAQQAPWPLDAAGTLGVPVTARAEEEGGWFSVRPALALFRISEGGVEPTGVISHPAVDAQASARMLGARERDGFVWTLSAARLAATPVPVAGCESGCEAGPGASLELGCE